MIDNSERQSGINEWRADLLKIAEKVWLSLDRPLSPRQLTLIAEELRREALKRTLLEPIKFIGRWIRDLVLKIIPDVSPELHNWWLWQRPAYNS